jgi:predicted PurR-regulated permease PerM
MNSPDIQHKAFLALLIAVSLAFAWILHPLYGAVFWGAILALVFQPVHRRLLRRMPGRRNLAALTTLSLVVLLAILPMAVIATSLVREATLLVQRVRSGELNFAAYFQQILSALPQSVRDLLDRLDLSDLADVQERLGAVISQAGQAIAGQALNIGQNALHFFVSAAVMLYLLFFLLRDGSALAARIRQAIPLDEDHKRRLLNKFTTVIRATVKGNIVVAATQGLLGGIIFAVLGIQGAVLWGVVMAFLSLLPAVGASLIWGPVAIYFFATGAIWQGVVLTAFGVFVIGLVDNVLRPVLVGKDTRMPDYVVLISTIGGMSLFGLNGFVIGPLVAALFMAAWDIFAMPRPDETA